MTNTYLHLAVEAGQNIIFEKLIELEENKDKRTSTGRTLFHYACLYGQTKIANFLMENASDFNMNLSVSDNDGRTAFHLACLDGHSEIVQILLEKSNEFSSINSENSGLQTTKIQDSKRPERFGCGIPKNS